MRTEAYDVAGPLEPDPVVRTVVADVAAGLLPSDRSAAWLEDLAAGPFTAVATVLATVLTRPH